MAIRVGKFIFWGLIWGYMIALFLSRSTWLEMRFNTSLSILAMTLLGVVIGFIKNINVKKRWFFISEILLIMLLIATYKDFSALAVIPAIKFKEAFFLNFLSLFQANIVVILLLIVGNILWCIKSKK
ncbi:MAG: hypothetical protein K0Q97_2689 [Bacillota bacterium]|jgi:hypothetical protein|nr:hypothetical protein [Bacillota bacterium]